MSVDFVYLLSVTKILFQCKQAEFIVVKTLPSSGYLTVTKIDGNDLYQGFRWNMTVPAQNAVMLSLKRNIPQTVHIYPECHLTLYNRSVGRSVKYSWEVWDIFRKDFGLASICQGPELLLLSHIRFKSPAAKQFQLFFSFFPENKVPKKLPSELWNCSVDHYAGFQHHLSCNLEVECEDGRDETEHCPYSSPDCQGLVASCNRCYKIIQTYKEMNEVVLGENSYKWAKNECRFLGGILSLPKCVYSGYDTFHAKTKRHQNMFHSIYVGLYTADISLPNMYRSGISSEDKTVIYHSVECTASSIFGDTKGCLHTTEFDPTYIIGSCQSILSFGAICEIDKNMTIRKTDTLMSVSIENPRSSLSTEEHFMTLCQGGHVIYTFLLCDSSWYSVCGLQETPCIFSDHLSSWRRFNGTVRQFTLMPTFTCKDQLTTLSYTLVCDFITDCQSDSDESFCSHSVCNNMFTCTNGQCLHYDKMCDLIKHCRDDSDETNCRFIKPFYTERPFFPSPALINFDGMMYFISVQMNSNDSCPDSHYRCPGDFNDCLPVYTRCNGMPDCIDHQDEEGCEDMACPGFLRCRLSTVCLHAEQICDGWPHCPKYDDELFCHVTCPVDCLCQGHSFLCPQPFSASLFPLLRSLEATGSGMTLSDVSNNTYLIHLVLAQCSLTRVPCLSMANLKFLDLSGNKLCDVNMTSFIGFKALQALSLANNPLSSLHADLSVVDQHSALNVLDLSMTSFTVFDSEAFSLFPHIQTLTLNHSSVHTISSDGFHFMPRLTELYMDGSPVKIFPVHVFKDLFYLKVVSSDNYKLCCHPILPDTLMDTTCHAPMDEISSCKDLLQSWTYRGILWLMTCLSIWGNGFCFCARCVVKSMKTSSGFGVFVSSLNIADFLMGVYVALIAIADEQFRGRYLHHDDIWKNSAACQVAGFLSLLSSETSALIIWFITLDRFVVLHLPFSTLRFGKRSAAMACLFIWLMAGLLALIPLLPVTAHWNFYSQTGICIPLPVTRREFPGRVYSFSIMIVFNFLLLVFISAGQAFIYRSVQRNTLKSTSTKISRDVTIARRLISVALSDFLCWFPIALCGILASLDLPVPGEVNVALAVLVLPINSAINPFLYTLNTLMEKRRRSKAKKLLKWLQSHADKYC